MKRSHILLLIGAASLGLLMTLLSTVVGRSDPILAAPRLDYASSDLSQKVNLPLYQISCTLATTTTDSLNKDNSSSDRAVALADYTGLALAVGDVPTDSIDVLAEEDWFRLDNAVISSTYEVETIPDQTTNYNLGIIVYDGDLTPIITDTTAANNRAEVTLVADSAGPYFFKVFQISAQCSGRTYHLNFSTTAPTPTPTNTPDPGADPYEPNDTKDTAYVFPVVTSATATNANFVPSDEDDDWFAFYVKSGRRYQVSTYDLSGVDTYVEVYDRSDKRVAHDNDSGGGFASRTEWQASYDGYYYIKVVNVVGISDSNDTYDLKIEQISVSATSTPGPVPTNPNADRCDRNNLGNHDFDDACVISANVSERFSFVPPPLGGPDNDYFKIWIKPGLLFECGTSDLSSGVDPNMIIYDNNYNPIGGNDDVEPGNFNSYLAYYATYEGWMYVLVGTGDRTPADVSNSGYTLSCDMQVPGQATATPGAEPTRTPVSEATPTRTPDSRTATPTPADSSTATPTPYEELTVRPLTTPTPVPVTTPAPRFIPIRLLVYYDGNDDQQPGAGEGIVGISAQAYEVATNQLLAQGFTDERGNVEFTVAAQGPVRVNVPFFGFSQLVAGEGASIYLRVPPQPLSEGTP